MKLLKLYESMRPVFESVRAEYEYVRDDGSVGLRLQGMRELVALYRRFDAKAPPVVCFELVDDRCTATIEGSSAEETVYLSECQIPGNPFWTKMPKTCLKNTAEARLYRRVYPLIVGGHYTEDEQTVDDQTPVQEPPMPQAVKTPINKDRHRDDDKVVEYRLKSLGDMEVLEAVRESGEITIISDPNQVALYKAEQREERKADDDDTEQGDFF